MKSATAVNLRGLAREAKAMRPGLGARSRTWGPPSRLTVPHAGSSQRGKTGRRPGALVPDMLVGFDIRAFQRAGAQRPRRREQQPLAEADVVVEKIDHHVL